MAKQKQTREVYRDAKDGQFTTKKEADKKPNEHVKETIKIPKKKK
jgi:hypothetical protein